MQKISTLALDTLNITNEEKELKRLLFNDNQNFDEPSESCINTILNFSKNLEVKKSETLGHINFLRS